MILRQVFCTGCGQQIRTVWTVMVRPWCPCNFFMIYAAAVPFVLQLDNQSMIWLLKCYIVIVSLASAGNAMSRFSP